MKTTRRQPLTDACTACAPVAVEGLPPAQAGSASPLEGADPAIVAKERFLSHWNCTQAVLEALAPHSGMPAEMLTQLTTPFAAGMWNGLTCGAVTGAMLALGLRHGRASDGDAKASEVTCATVRELVATLSERFGNLACSALLGTDMATDAGVKEAAAKGLFASKCPLLVEAAAREGLRLMG